MRSYPCRAFNGRQFASANYPMSGHHGKSRYDVDVALSCAMAACAIGFQQLCSRRDYDIETWSKHFDSKDAALTWKRGCVRVTIVAAYTAMVESTSVAVTFMKDQIPYWARTLYTEIKVCCVSADAIQGETLDFMVLALPPSTSQFSQWICNPSRLPSYPGTTGSWQLYTFLTTDPVVCVIPRTQFK